MAKRILLWFLLATVSLAAEVVPALDVEGVQYTDVKFGPVNQGKITLFHSRGVTAVPLSSLPEDYQQQFATKQTAPTIPIPQEVSEPAPTPVSLPPKPAQPNPGATLEAMRTKKTEPSTAGGGTSDWARYNRERASIVVLDGKLVEKVTLTSLIGFLAKEHAQLNDGQQAHYGAALDLAVRKNQNDQVAAAMEMRPALWRRTDERVFLVNYKPMTLPGALMKVYVLEIDPIDQWRTFKVGAEPSFEDWKRLPRK
ncbi:MAG: hypothetical protein WCS70_09390 [Verrucomicrobiota bacterium]